MNTLQFLITTTGKKLLHEKFMHVLFAYVYNLYYYHFLNTNDSLFVLKGICGGGNTMINYCFHW